MHLVATAAKIGSSESLVQRFLKQIKQLYTQQTV